MLEFTEVLFQRWRLLLLSTFFLPGIMICILAPVVHAHSKNLLDIPESSYDNFSSIDYDGPNVVTGVLASIADNTNQAANNAQRNVVKGVVAFSSGVTNFDKTLLSGTQQGASFVAKSVAKTIILPTRAVGSAVNFVGHTTSKTFNFLTGVTNISSVIRPAENKVVPSITELRIEQAEIIKKGTKSVIVKPKSFARGGACDNGHGNGGYPAKWCNSPMDTIVTISGRTSRINRECTSYAYWYFTKIEGNEEFIVSGDAKYWAQNSNYPKHSKPAVGSIAVETGGTYGHVAIVHALPSQKFAGKKVPAGYLLVSEMNYDWNGHFRYSYSPVSKFTSYIYK